MNKNQIEGSAEQGERTSDREALVTKAWRRKSGGRAAVVPAKAISEMMNRWEVPAPVEADQVEYWVNGERVPR